MNDRIAHALTIKLLADAPEAVAAGDRRRLHRGDDDIGLAGGCHHRIRLDGRLNGRHIELDFGA